MLFGRTSRGSAVFGDYGVITDMHSCTLVSRTGSIDRACFPRFESPELLARLLDWERPSLRFGIVPSPPPLRLAILAPCRRSSADRGPSVMVRRLEAIRTGGQ